MKSILDTSCLALLLCLSQAAVAQDEPSAAAPPAAIDEVKLKDGSTIIGKITDMADGNLSIETAFGVDKIVKVKWSEVAQIRTENVHNLQLSDDSEIKGKIVRVENGAAVVTNDAIQGEATVPLDQVKRINPPPKDVELTGTINFGATINDGNTQTKSAALNGEAVARSERQRLTIRAAWNYAEDSVSGITARNTRGGLKYDFFVIPKKFYFYGSAYLEEDRFQDLNLRTAIAAGPGYQFFNKGDIQSPTWLNQFELYGEIGVAFFNEDFMTGPDNRYVSGRWALRADLPINSLVTLFHYQEGYPGFENLEDLYITTSQGVRFTIWKNFVGTIQVDWRWDNTPSPGFERSDTLYLMTLGYQFKI